MSSTVLGMALAFFLLFVQDDPFAGHDEAQAPCLRFGRLAPRFPLTVNKPG